MSVLYTPRWGVAIAFLCLLSAASLVAFFVEKGIVADLAEENEALRTLTNEMQRLRTDNTEIARLREENQEMDRLRNDNKALLKLRNEVHQLREEKAQWEKARGGMETSRALTPNQRPGHVNSSGGPATLAADASNSATQQVTRPWVGLYYVKIPHSQGATNSISERISGALVSLVQPSSPAEIAGLQVDDIVVAVDERQIKTVQDLDAALRKLVIGQGFVVDVVRQGAQLRFQMQVGERPQPR